MASVTWSTGELEFAKTFSTERYKLLELQPELEEALATGMPVELHIKGPRGSGDKEQSATLCTEKTTYMMRKAESSNTHLLLSAEESRKTIAGQVDFAYELIRVAPRVGPVALLLQDRAFGEELCHVSTASVLEDPQCVASAGWTFSELAARIQASNEEIRAELARLGAFELGCRWMTVDEKLESDVIAQCISVVVETGMDAKKVSTRAVSNALEHRFGDFCISKVMDRYTTQKTTREDGDAIISLDASKVARFCAEEIFKQSTDPALDADEFLRSWELALPKGVGTSESALAGLALRLEEGSGGRQVYKYFPATRLPSDFKSCFAELFAARKQWKLADIEPYIAHLLGPSVKKADLLRRFTRSVRVSLSSDERVLTSR